MSNHEYMLKSGATISVTTAAFDIAVALVEAVKAATVGMSADAEVTGDVVLSSPVVRKALFPAFRGVLWKCDGKVLPIFDGGSSIFDHVELGEKARGDYFEICAKVVEANCSPFFLKTSSESKTLSGLPTANQESS